MLFEDKTYTKIPVKKIGVFAFFYSKYIMGLWQLFGKFIPVQKNREKKRACSS